MTVFVTNIKKPGDSDALRLALIDTIRAHSRCKFTQEQLERASLDDLRGYAAFASDVSDEEPLGLPSLDFSADRANPEFGSGPDEEPLLPPRWDSDREEK